MESIPIRIPAQWLLIMQLVIVGDEDELQYTPCEELSVIVQSVIVGDEADWQHIPSWELLVIVQFVTDGDEDQQ